MKTIIQIVLWIVCIGLGYLIYQSVEAPIEFKNVKQERYAQVISKLKDIRDSEEAYRTVNGKYTKNFDELIRFIEVGKYTITQTRDSSFMEFDKHYGIDMLREVKIIDTLAFISVKDSLFKSDNRYKTMMIVPFAKNGEKFELDAGIIEKSGYKAPVYEAKVKKNVVLYDQPKDLMSRENTYVNVEEVNGDVIKVGSMKEVSTNGNWPPIYDKKDNK